MINIQDIKQETVHDPAEETQRWMWCQRCQRCYAEGEHRLVKGIKLCPYEECLGLIFIDGWPWSRIQKTYINDYPKIPEREIIYPNSL